MAKRCASGNVAEAAALYHLPSTIYHSARVKMARALTNERAVDPVHQRLVLDGALEAHLGLTSIPDRRVEIAVHRLVAADVLEAREQEARHAPAAGQHERAVGFEADDPAPAEQLRHAQTAQQ